MSSTIGYSVLQVIPSAKGFGAALSQQVNPQMSAAGKSSGISFGKVLGAAAVGGFLASGISKIIHTGISETMDASAGVAQLAAGIKSTGNAANVSVKGMEALAGSIQGFSGQTDDSIVAAEQLLLTFTNIKNNGPDKIFDQATLAAANMAAKMGGDASSNAILLGKALNDPIQGISALTRVGVAFTKGQKDSIAAMQKSGDVAGAQKIILKELNTEFGGAAKAAGESLPGGVKIAQRAFEDASQSMAEKFIPIVLPAFTKLATLVTSKVVPAVSNWIDGFIKGTNTAGKLKDMVVDVYKIAFKPFVDFLWAHRSTISTWVINLGLMYGAFKALLFITKVTAALKFFILGLKDGTVALKIMYAWEARVATLNPFGWVALAVTGLALLWKSLDDHAGGATSQLRNMAGGGRGAGNAIAAAAAASTAAIAAQAASTDHPTRSPKPNFVSKVPHSKGGGTYVDPAKLLDAINLKIAVENQKKTLGDFVRYLGTDFIASVKDSGTRASDIIGKLVSGVDGLAKGFAATITDSVKQGSFNLASTKIVNALETKLLGFQSAFNAIQTAREELKTNIADADSALKDAIKLRSDAAGSIADLLSKPFGQPSELVKQLSGAEATADSILGGYNSMVKMVTDRFKSIKGDKKDALLGFLKDSTAQLLDFAKQRADTAKLLEDAQNKLEDAIKTKSSYADSLASGLKTAGLSLTEFFDKEKGATSPVGIIAGFKARLAALKGFSANLKALAGRGLNQGLIDQIVGMGTTDGGALAASLSAAGNDQIDALNATGVEISATADSLGSALSDKFYGQSVANAQSIVKGYKDTQEMINAAMRSITSGIALEMSPLTDSMASLGEDSAQALLDGFKSQDNALIAQAASLGARMAQAVADALAALKVASGGADFGAADAKASAARMADDAAKLLRKPPSIATTDVAAKLAAIQETERENRRQSQSKAATSSDIAALGNRIDAALSGQARKLQAMDRQGG